MTIESTMMSITIKAKIKGMAKSIFDAARCYVIMAIKGGDLF
jgi:hypothetical protein